MKQRSRKKLSTIFEFLDNPLVIASAYDLENFPYKQVNFYEPEPSENKKEATEEIPEDIDIITSDGKKIDLEKDEFSSFELAENKLVEKTDERAKPAVGLINARWLIEEEIGNTEEKLNLGFSEAPTINSNYEALYNTITDFARQGYKILIAAENDLQTNKLRDLLSNLKTELEILIDDGTLRFETLAIYRGFTNRQEKLLLLTDYSIFNKPYRTKVTQKSKPKKSRSKEFASIKRGDLVVHEEYGIGKYLGLESIKNRRGGTGIDENSV